MIRFECKICSRRIEADDKNAGEQMKCPQCSTLLVVPGPQHVTIKIKTRAERQPDTHIDEESQQKSCEEPVESDGLDKDLEGLVEEGAPADGRGFANLYFDEGLLFMISFSLLVLLAIDSNMRRDVHTFILRLCGSSTLTVFLGVCFLLVPFFAGLVLSVFHAFSKKEKTFFEKATMLFFAVAVIAGTGLYAGWYIWVSSNSFWLLIFAVWNVIYSGLLIVNFERIVFADELDGEYVSDFDASFSEVLFGAVAAVIIIFCCGYWLKFHWVITYSICTTFASGLGRMARGIFGLRQDSKGPDN